MFGCCQDNLYSEQVPEEFRELAIYSGYRRPGLSFTESLSSLFTLHNETLNVWTHVISLLFYISYILYLFSQPIDLLQPENQAILCLLVACCIFPLCSSLAHLFSSMSPVIRHTCFMLDYLGITIYAFGACLTNYIYAIPSAWRGSIFDKYFISCMFICCVLCVILACHTRFMPRNKKSTKILRLGAFALPYLFGMFPCMYRVAFCDNDHSCDGAAYYSQHFFDTIFTVTFYGAHVPEIIFPGYFDVFFQSHSIFHVSVVVGTFHHLQGNIVDMLNRPIVDHSQLSCSPVVPLALLVLLNSCSVLYFVRKMYHQQRIGSKSVVSNGRYHESVVSNGKNHKSVVSNGRNHKD